MIDDNWQSFKSIDDGWWWSNKDQWWSMMSDYDGLVLSMFNDDWQRSIVIENDWQWLMIIHDNQQWLMMIKYD